MIIFLIPHPRWGYKAFLSVFENNTSLILLIDATQTPGIMCTAKEFNNTDTCLFVLGVK